jgi:F-type H+-transporting ATPase subunit delta
MAETSTLARPYARAAFEYAREHEALALWSGQLATAAAVTQDEGMNRVLNNPSLTGERRAEILADVCGDALNSEARNYLSILSANDRLGLLSEISTQFEQLKANLEKSVEVEVISAFDLADAARDRLGEVLSRRFQREVKVTTSTDRDLLGGVLIRAGDLVIDGSVRGKLNKLAEAMNS